jgi:hypothetical protein
MSVVSAKIIAKDKKAAMITIDGETMTIEESMKKSQEKK